MSIQANQGGGVTIFSAGGTGGGGGGTPGGSSGQLQYNASGSFGGMSGTAWNDTTRSLTLTGATVTTSNPVFDLSQTWNAGATTFTAIKMNVTDTASASASLLMDLQTGGISRFSVTKGGAATFVNGSGTVSIGTSGIDAGTFFILKATGITFGSAQDCTFRRVGAASLQLGATDAAAPVAQTLGVQSVVAGTSNTAGQNFTIKGSAGTGTGAGGSIIFQVAPAGSSGTAQNAFSTALTIAGTGAVKIRTGTSTNPIEINEGGTGGFGFYQAAAYHLALGYSSAGSGPYSTNYGFSIYGDAGFHLSGTRYIGWTSSNTVSTTVDVILARDAANTLALKNGANAQELRVYKNTTGTVYKAMLGDNNLIKISGEAFTNGAGASTGTLTNAPAVGNPTKWIPIDDNGTTRYIPAW